MKPILKLLFIFTVVLLSSCASSHLANPSEFDKYVSVTSKIDSRKSVFYENLSLDRPFDKMKRPWGIDNKKLLYRFNQTKPLYDKGYLIDRNPNSRSEKKRFSLSVYFKELKHLENSRITRDIYDVNFIIRDSISNKIVFSKVYKISKSKETVFSIRGDDAITGKDVFENLANDLDKVIVLPQENKYINIGYDDLVKSKVNGKIESDGYRYDFKDMLSLGVNYFYGAPSYSFGLEVTIWKNRVLFNGGGYIGSNISAVGFGFSYFPFKHTLNNLFIGAELEWGEYFLSEYETELLDSNNIYYTDNKNNSNILNSNYTYNPRLGYKEGVNFKLGYDFYLSSAYVLKATAFYKYNDLPVDVLGISQYGVSLIFLIDFI